MFKLNFGLDVWNPTVYARAIYLQISLDWICVFFFFFKMLWLYLSNHFKRLKMMLQSMTALLKLLLSEYIKRKWERYVVAL